MLKQISVCYNRCKQGKKKNSEYATSYKIGFDQVTIEEAFPTPQPCLCGAVAGCCPLGGGRKKKEEDEGSGLAAASHRHQPPPKRQPPAATAPFPPQPRPRSLFTPGPTAEPEPEPRAPAPQRPPAPGLPGPSPASRRAGGGSAGPSGWMARMGSQQNLPLPLPRPPGLQEMRQQGGASRGSRSLRRPERRRSRPGKELRWGEG